MKKQFELGCVKGYVGLGLAGFSKYPYAALNVSTPVAGFDLSYLAFKDSLNCTGYYNGHKYRGHVSHAGHKARNIVSTIGNVVRGLA